MREFARLYAALDASTSTVAKVQALREHLARVPAADAAWAVYLLAGGKPRQAVPTRVMRQAACEAAGIDDWLFEECYQVVGDLAETIAHVLPHGELRLALEDEAPAMERQAADQEGGEAAGPAEPAHERKEPPLSAAHGLAAWMEHGVLPLRALPVQDQLARLRGLWSLLDAPGRFLLTKLVGGGFRVGVSRLLVQRALAEHAGLQADDVAQRMMGWTQASVQPSAQAYEALLRPAQGDERLDEGRPYPFFLAQAVDAADEARMEAALGPVSDWLIEWKYDGIRAQLIRRGQGVWIWSRGEELVTERFGEVVDAAMTLPPGTVLDGELLVMREGRPAAFAELQTRITRKTVTRALRESTPVSFMAYDLLEHEGRDCRTLPQLQRRALLEAVLSTGPFAVSPAVPASTWQEARALRAESRERGVEGFMLKHRQAPYGVGRRKGDASGVAAWWKWKVEPMTVDAVLVYAQAGHGRRANLYTDYTFAVWSQPPRDEEEVQAVLEAIGRGDPPDPQGLRLVPFAKAYSGLSDEEFAQVDRIIRRTTVEKFGPVRSVVPSLVFELGFEGLAASPRHKSGVAVRFPRMLRWRQDKPLREADTLQTLKALSPAGR